jgi:hypothetical protein
MRFAERILLAFTSRQILVHFGAGASGRRSWRQRRGLAATPEETGAAVLNMLSAPTVMANTQHGQWDEPAAIE